MLGSSDSEQSLILSIFRLDFKSVDKMERMARDELLGGNVKRKTKIDEPEEEQASRPGGSVCD